MGKRKLTVQLESCLFTHEPLTGGGQEIRLLRFVKKRNYGRLRKMDLEISTWHLEDAPPYVAASYTWGSPDDKTWITLDGQYYEVRQNCYDALAQIRRQDSEAYVWLDSICINQSDLDEKALQVEMMGDVYQRATVVYSCVGEHADCSEDVLKVVKEVAAHVEGTSISEISVELAWQKLQSLKPSRLAQLDEHCKPWDTLDEDFKTAFKKFGDRPYWKRIWIVQEVRLADQCFILCGDDCVSIDDFAPYLECIAAHSRFTTTREHPRDGERRLWQNCGLSRVIKDPNSDLFDSSYWTSGARRRRFDWSEVFSTFTLSQCADSRDHLYALSKLLAWPEPGVPLRPDYRISCFQLLVKFVRHLQAVSWDYARCSMQVRKLLRAFGTSVHEEEVKGALVDRRLQLLDSDLSGRAGTVFCASPEDSGNAIRLIELANGSLSLDVAVFEPAGGQSPSDEAYSSRVGQEIWIEGHLVGYVCPRARAGDYLLDQTSGSSRSQWLVLRFDPVSGVYEVIGSGFPSKPRTVISNVLIDDDEYESSAEQTMLYPAVLNTFDLWLGDEDLVMWMICRASMEAETLTEADRDLLLEYHVAKSRFSSYAVRSDPELLESEPEDTEARDLLEQDNEEFTSSSEYDGRFCGASGQIYHSAAELAWSRCLSRKRARERRELWVRLGNPL